LDSISLSSVEEVEEKESSLIPVAGLPAGNLNAQSPLGFKVD
jgi:hypothetical protein